MAGTTPACIARFDDGEQRGREAAGEGAVPALSLASSLSAMRAALVCDACHDLLEVPMILPQCGHTFCSRCIRSYLDCKGPVLGDCPSCREKVRPDELVRNVKLKEVIVQCLLRPIMTTLLPGFRQPSIRRENCRSRYIQLEASLLRQTLAKRDTEGQREAAGVDRGAKRARASPGQETERSREDSDSDFEAVEAPASSKRRRTSSNSLSRSSEGQRAAPTAGRRSSRLSLCSPAVASAATPASDPARDGELQRDNIVDLSQDSYADGASAMAQREKEKRGSGGDGRVACPICSMSVSVRNINAHMDTCLSKTTAATERGRDGPLDRCAERPASAGPTGGEVAAGVAPVGPVARMPKLTYHVLKEPQLRKLCRDLGLSTRGDRNQLEWRHRQYAQEHNTACDAEEAPNPRQIVLEIERRERNLAAPTQSRPSIFSRQTSASSAAESTGESHRDTSQDAAFEELIQQIEARMGRERKRVYTYVYESDEEDGDDHAVSADPGAMFRMGYGSGAAAIDVDLRVEADAIRFTELLQTGASSEKIGFAGLSWEITDDGLTLMSTVSSAAVASRKEWSFRCPKEVAMDVERAVIAAMQAERQQQQHAMPAAAAVTLANATAADTVTHTDSAERSAVSLPADALTTVLSTHTDSSCASATSVASAADVTAVPDDEADAKVCRVCYCSEGELDGPVPVAASATVTDATGAGAHAPADLLQPCKCSSWIHRKCLQDWVSSRSASTDERRRCEVCEEPIDAADRAGALQAAPPPSVAQLKAVGIKRFSALCGFMTCSLAGTGEHYHCVSGHEMAGRKCIYSSKDPRHAERHGLAMTRLAERRRRDTAQAWSRVAA